MAAADAGAVPGKVNWSQAGGNALKHYWHWTGSGLHEHTLDFVLHKIIYIHQYINIHKYYSAQLCLRLSPLLVDAAGTLCVNVSLRLLSIRLKAHSYTFTILKMNLPSSAEISRLLTFF